MTTHMTDRISLQGGLHSAPPAGRYIYDCVVIYTW